MINRIQAQKHGTLTEQDRLDLLRLLGKAGYAVQIGREKKINKPNAPIVHFVEYWERGSEASPQVKGE